MLRSYFKIALRNLVRDKAYFLIVAASMLARRSAKRHTLRSKNAMRFAPRALCPKETYLKKLTANIHGGLLLTPNKRERGS